MKNKGIEQFLKEARLVHDNRYSYDHAIYINDKTKIIITCPIHGDFYQNPYYHTKGGGCKECASRKSTTDTFIYQANQIHGNTYTYNNVVYINNRSRVTITCPIHGDFDQRPYNHLKGSGCTLCTRRSTLAFVLDANKIHNNKYTYDNSHYVYNKKVLITCPIHGDFSQLPGAHLNGSGCPKCVGLYRTTDEFIRESKTVHNNKYSYHNTQYIDSSTKLIITCPIHGEFRQRPSHHLDGTGCPKCIYNRKSLEEFILEANTAHDNRYSYEKSIYVNVLTKLIITCPIHGDFEQTPGNHLYQYNGCPQCYHRHSQISIEWLNSLMTQDNIHITHAGNGGEFAIPGTKYKADGYCVESNTIYEFYGDYWHGNPAVFDAKYIHPITKKLMGDLYNHTLQREQLIRNLGYNLITIWENEYNNLRTQRKNIL